MKKFAYRQYSIRELYDSYTRDEIIFPSQYNEIPWIKQHKEKLLNMIIHRYPVKGIAIHVDFIMEKNSNIPAIKNFVNFQKEKDCSSAVLFFSIAYKSHEHHIYNTTRKPKVP